MKHKELAKDCCETKPIILQLNECGLFMKLVKNPIIV